MTKGFTPKQRVLIAMGFAGAAILSVGQLWLWAYALGYTADRTTGLWFFVSGLLVGIVACGLLVWDIRWYFKLMLNGPDFGKKEAGKDDRT